MVWSAWALALLLCVGTAQAAEFPRVTPVFQRPLQAVSAARKRPLSAAAVADPALFTDAGCVRKNATVAALNALLLAGGPGYTLSFCPASTYSLNETLAFAAPSQTITTMGSPLGKTRATLRLVGNATTAIWGGCDQSCNGVTIRSLIIDGARTKLGHVAGAPALIELGGASNGQTVRDCKIGDPRGCWLTSRRGHDLLCKNSSIINNQIGPCGESPAGKSQFRKRAATPKSPPGRWADGISMSCASSLIAGNTITDATDGAIVLFGSPGTVVKNNTVIQKSRNTMGGLNVVDGNSTVLVTGNQFITQGATMKIGVALGPLAWGNGLNSMSFRTWGMTVQGNTFTSIGKTGSFGYAIAASGVNNAVLGPNTVSGARFGAAMSDDCVQKWLPPTPQALVADPKTLKNVVLSGAFDRDIPIRFPICLMSLDYGPAYKNKKDKTVG